MREDHRVQVSRIGRSRALFVLFVAITLGISIATVRHYSSDTQFGVFTMSNLVGPTAQSFLAGRGLSVCTEAMGTPGNPICFHAARMPVASLIVALGARLLGEDFTRVNVLKAVLLLVPLYAGVYLAWRSLPHSGLRRLAISLVLIAPFGITVFLSDVRLMQVEEGYSYSLLAFAVAVLLFAFRPPMRSGPLVAASLGLSVAGLYLTKSSMLPLVIALVASYCILEWRWEARAIVLGLVITAPICWALHQHHASGRYSIGTSLDGLNLHKGNNPEFLGHYPPPPGHSLDDFDGDLNRGRNFADEWSFDDFHRQAGIDYIRTHLPTTLHGEARKLGILFFSVHKYGSSEVAGTVALVEVAGLVLFRMLQWTALAGAIYWLCVGDISRRISGGIFLAVVAAYVLPYFVGFAYTRHASVLIYPSALMCCRLLTDETLDRSATPS